LCVCVCCYAPQMARNKIRKPGKGNVLDSVELRSVMSYRNTFYNLEE
jgi:hypothetical protein